MAHNEQFIVYGKEATMNSDVTAGNLKNTSIAFVEESGKEAIRTQGKVYQTVPSNGKDGQILVSNNGKGQWQSFNYLDAVSYGVQWTETQSDPHLTRIGSMEFHKTLPIQSQMKGCIFNATTKQVVYWLDDDDWKYKKGGNPDKGETEDLARLDGYDGEIYVHIPEFWIKSWINDGVRSVRISTIKIDDTWQHQEELYVSAYKVTLLRSVPEDMGYLSTLTANTPISVVNDNDYCRGGNNDATNDAEEDVFRRQLNKPATLINRNSMRKYARQNNKEVMNYKQYKNIIYWLYVIEYANFNCQESYKAGLTSDGLHQGGLGTGITNMGNWGKYNNNYPICTLGYTNDLGNGTGIKSFTIPEFTVDETTQKEQTLQQVRYRGIEGLFGDIWQNIDGIICDNNTDNHEKVGYNYIYTTEDPSLYGDTAEAMGKMKLTGYQIASEGYIKLFDLGDTAEIIPYTVGGNSTTYKSDYNYCNSNSTTLTTVVLGGAANGSAPSGVGCFYSLIGVLTSWTGRGFRVIVTP